MDRCTPWQVQQTTGGRVVYRVKPRSQGEIAAATPARGPLPMPCLDAEEAVCEPVRGHPGRQTCHRCSCSHSWATQPELLLLILSSLQLVTTCDTQNRISESDESGIRSRRIKAEQAGALGARPGDLQKPRRRPLQPPGRGGSVRARPRPRWKGWRAIEAKLRPDTSAAQRCMPEAWYTNQSRIRRVSLG